MSTSRETERTRQDLLRRLTIFRHELAMDGDVPPRAALERALARAGELGLGSEDVAPELENLRAAVAAADMTTRVAARGLPIVRALDPMPTDDLCHFVSPVRFGRRRADQFGHLVLSTARLTFRGALDLRIAWSEVAAVRREGREVVVGLHASRRVLRFSCRSLVEAAEGEVIARHLAGMERPTAADPCQASV